MSEAVPDLNVVVPVSLVAAPDAEAATELVVNLMKRRAASFVASLGCRPQPSSALARPVPSPRMKRWRMSGGSRTV
jgi:hypothetical protein